MLLELYCVVLFSHLYVSASLLCSADGWSAVSNILEPLVLQELSKDVYIFRVSSLPSMVRGIMVVCYEENYCASGFVQTSWLSSGTNHSIVELLVVDEFVSAQNSTHMYSDCSFAVPPCFLKVRGKYGNPKTHYELDRKGVFLLEFLVSLVHFERSSDADQNTSDYGSNAVVNVSANISDHSNTTMIESYMYRIPEWYLGSLVKLSVPDLLDVHVEEIQQTPFMRTISVNIWQKTLRMGSTELKFTLPAAPTSCAHKTVFSAAITVGCPPGKVLDLVGMGDLINGSGSTFMLPVNYRPPSRRGHDIATSPHVYNVDPSEPLRSSRFQISQTSYILKQCKGKTHRSECNCTDDMRYSSQVSHSDCIDRAYEHHFGVPFGLRFVLSTVSGGTIPAVGNCSFEEVNKRTDFVISGVDDSVQWFIVDLGDKIITFKGSGLYHFEFELQSNESFCDLDYHLMVFVTKQPMSRFAEFFVNILSTVVCGISLLCTYLCYKRFHRHLHHHHHTH